MLKTLTSVFGILAFSTSCSDNATAKPQLPNRIGTKYTLYADTHVGSKYISIDNVLPTSRTQVLAENAYDLGDTLEIKNAEPENCVNILQMQKNMQIYFSDRYVTGNHSVDKSKGPLNLIVNDHILITHGDIPLWGIDKSQKFRNKKRCQGSGWFQDIIQDHPGTLNNSEKNDLAAYAKQYKTDTIIIGHIHPTVLIDTIWKEVHIIVAPRGKVTIYLP